MLGYPLKTVAYSGSAGWAQARGIGPPLRGEASRSNRHEKSKGSTSSQELYELLVLRRGWAIGRYGRFVAEGMTAALLPRPGDQLQPGFADP